MCSGCADYAAGVSPSGQAERLRHNALFSASTLHEPMNQVFVEGIAIGGAAIFHE